jgi:hypothetical protein
MVKQHVEFENCKLSAAKLHRHQRVQKILANRRSSCASRNGYASSDDVSSVSTSSSGEVCLSKQERRRLRNRQSASDSRLKKKKETETLQSRIQYLEHENSILRSLITEKYPSIQIELLQFQKTESNHSSPCHSDGTSTRVQVPATAVSNNNEFAIHF